MPQIMKMRLCDAIKKAKKEGSILQKDSISFRACLTKKEAQALRHKSGETNVPRAIRRAVSHFLKS